MTFRVALSGLNAATSDLSVTANNIANANTVGFKESRALFSEIVASSSVALSVSTIGSGTRLTDVQQQFDQGNIEFTNNGLDLALSGDGFFTLSQGGALSYTRDGAFSLNRDGYLVNTAGLRVQGFAPNAAGSFNTASLTDIRLASADSAPRATTSIDLMMNLPADAVPPVTAPFDPADGTSFTQSTALTVFDSLGASHTLTSYYVKTATPGEWDVHVTLDGTAVGAGAVGTLTFDGNGNLTTPAGGDITLPAVPVSNGANDLALTLNFAPATQYGDFFSVNSLNQDGYATGRLVGVEVNEDGVIQARFTNGQTNALGQLALTKFTNPQGLSQLGENSWGESFDSGVAQLGQAGNNGLGLIQSGALEGSNVDITEQLVNMIAAQRNFQANAQMITTFDQVTQTALNIR